jgi:Ca2+-binding EF-hand superfamily protein
VSAKNLSPQSNAKSNLLEKVPERQSSKQPNDTQPVVDLVEGSNEVVPSSGSAQHSGREAWALGTGANAGTLEEPSQPPRSSSVRGGSVSSAQEAVLRGEGRGIQIQGEQHHGPPQRQPSMQNPGFAKRPLGCRLSKELWDKLERMFSAMDTDHSNFVSREEAKDFFKGAFSKISADAMFKEIDTDHSGAITADEFMNFWVQVKKSGYSDEDISEEIDNLLEGNAWVDWKDERNAEKGKAESFPKRGMMSRVSAETWVKCEALFREIDQDGSLQITRPKALKHFKGAFSKVSAEAFFNEVDTKGHGTITPKDFMNFWVQVRNAGYKDKEIRDEVEMLMEGQAWRDWKDGRTT